MDSPLICRTLRRSPSLPARLPDRRHVSFRNITLDDLYVGTRHQAGGGKPLLQLLPPLNPYACMPQQLKRDLQVQTGIPFKPAVTHCLQKLAQFTITRAGLQLMYRAAAPKFTWTLTQPVLLQQADAEGRPIGPMCGVLYDVMVYDDPHQDRHDDPTQLPVLWLRRALVQHADGHLELSTRSIYQSQHAQSVLSRCDALERYWLATMSAHSNTCQTQAGDYEAAMGGGLFIDDALPTHAALPPGASRAAFATALYEWFRQAHRYGLLQRCNGGALDKASFAQLKTAIQSCRTPYDFAVFDCDAVRLCNPDGQVCKQPFGQIFFQSQHTPTWRSIRFARLPVRLDPVQRTMREQSLRLSNARLFQQTFRAYASDNGNFMRLSAADDSLPTRENVVLPHYDKRLHAKATPPRAPALAR